MAARSTIFERKLGLDIGLKQLMSSELSIDLFSQGRATDLQERHLHEMLHCGYLAVYHQAMATAALQPHWNEVQTAVSLMEL